MYITEIVLCLNIQVQKKEVRTHACDFFEKKKITQNSHSPTLYRFTPQSYIKLGCFTFYFLTI